MNSPDVSGCPRECASQNVSNVPVKDRKKCSNTAATGPMADNGSVDAANTEGCAHGPKAQGIKWSDSGSAPKNGSLLQVYHMNDSSSHQSQQSSLFSQESSNNCEIDDKLSKRKAKKPAKGKKNQETPSRMSTDAPSSSTSSPSGRVGQPDPVTKSDAKPVEVEGLVMAKAPPTKLKDKKVKEKVPEKAKVDASKSSKVSKSPMRGPENRRTPRMGPRPDRLMIPYDKNASPVWAMLIPEKLGDDGFPRLAGEIPTLQFENTNDDFLNMYMMLRENFLQLAVDHKVLHGLVPNPVLIKIWFPSLWAREKVASEWAILSIQTDLKAFGRAHYLHGNETASILADVWETRLPRQFKRVAELLRQGPTKRGWLGPLMIVRVAKPIAWDGKKTPASITLRAFEKGDSVFQAAQLAAKEITEAELPPKARTRKSVPYSPSPSPNFSPSASTPFVSSPSPTFSSTPSPMFSAQASAMFSPKPSPHFTPSRGPSAADANSERVARMSNYLLPAALSLPAAVTLTPSVGPTQPPRIEVKSNAFLSPFLGPMHIRPTSPRSPVSCAPLLLLDEMPELDLKSPCQKGKESRDWKAIQETWGSPERSPLPSPDIWCNSNSIWGSPQMSPLPELASPLVGPLSLLPPSPVDDNCEVCTVEKAYESEAPGYMSIKVGEEVKMIRNTTEIGDRNCLYAYYVFATNTHNESGWVPKEILRPVYGALAAL